MYLKKNYMQGADPILKINLKTNVKVLMMCFDFNYKYTFILSKLKQRIVK
jgi:hypothetical protein